MQIGMYIPGSSLLHRMHGAGKLVCFCLLLAAVILTDSLWGYLLMIGCTAVIIKLGGLPMKEAVRPVTGLKLFLLLIFVMNAVFFEGEQVLWSWWILHISADGMIQGANVVLRVMLLMVLANILTLVTAPIELTGAMEILLRPLGLLGIPVGEVAMILSVAMQFIPVLTEEAAMIQKAQTARGARFESRHLHDRAASILPLAVPIFLAAFRRADELSIAMEARGYCRTKGRTSRVQVPFGYKDTAALLICAGICLIQFFL